MHPDGITLPFEDARFWAKVDFNGPVPERYPELGPCWLWTAGTSTQGYGRFNWKGRMQRSHRVVFMRTYPQTPEPECVCHHCDTPACQNPAHLFAGTRDDNNKDKAHKGRVVTLSGDAHHSRAHPERLVRGDAHHSRTHPETLARGGRHGNAKLTESQVYEIRLRYSLSLLSLAMMAKEYGVSKATIQRIVSRAGWQHVP